MQLPSRLRFLRNDLCVLYYRDSSCGHLTVIQIFSVQSYFMEFFLSVCLGNIFYPLLNIFYVSVAYKNLLSTYLFSSLLSFSFYMFISSSTRALILNFSKNPSDHILGAQILASCMQDAKTRSFFKITRNSPM